MQLWCKNITIILYHYFTPPPIAKDENLSILWPFLTNFNQFVLNTFLYFILFQLLNSCRNIFNKIYRLYVNFCTQIFQKNMKQQQYTILYTTNCNKRNNYATNNCNYDIKISFSIIISHHQPSQGTKLFPFYDPS